jgi:hypothetical protein
VTSCPANPLQTRPVPRGVTFDAATLATIRRVVLAKVPLRRLDPDDVIQQVLLTIHRRNALPSAYDPSLSGLAHYVYMVGENVVGHMSDSPKWRRECLDSDDELEATDDRAPLDAHAEVDEAAVNVDASRELGELVPRSPRQLWQIALEQRERGEYPPRPQDQLRAEARALRRSGEGAGVGRSGPRPRPTQLAIHVALVAQLRASLAAHEVANAPPATQPIARRRLRGAVSWFFDDLAKFARGPLAGHTPSGADILSVL